MVRMRSRVRSPVLALSKREKGHAQKLKNVEENFACPVVNAKYSTIGALLGEGTM